MKTMDRKIAQRRHGVTEQRAATRLRIVIALAALVAVLAAAFWIIRSPLLSIDRVVVSGEEHSNPRLVIDRLGVTVGTPTISVDAAALESALLADPWIADVTVVVTWPGSVEVELIEHQPVALVQAANGLAHVTPAGNVVQLLDDASGWPVINTVNKERVRAGGVTGGSAVLGALEFVTALPAELRSATVITIDAAQQISAMVGEHPVRLGRAVDMSAKASALTAVIGHGIEPGSPIDVSAPRRPAVGNPHVEVEGEG